MNELSTQEELRSSARMERNRLVHLGHARENRLCGCNADKQVDVIVGHDQITIIVIRQANPIVSEGCEEKRNHLKL